MGSSLDPELSSMLSLPVRSTRKCDDTAHGRGSLYLSGPRETSR